jgi:hypothetical protein
VKDNECHDEAKDCQTDEHVDSFALEVFHQHHHTAENEHHSQSERKRLEIRQPQNEPDKLGFTHRPLPFVSLFYVERRVQLGFLPPVRFTTEVMKFLSRKVSVQ